MKSETVDYAQEVYTNLLEQASESNVYGHVHALPDEWELISSEEAKSYLPNPNPLKVTFGITKRKTQTIDLFEAVSLDETIKHKRGFIVNTGGSIWGLDYVPKRPSVDSQPLVDYLAISGYKSTTEHHTINETQKDYKNCIQIWECDRTALEDKPTKKPRLSMCLVHNFGICHDMKWCPYGAYEEIAAQQGTWAKLGILAVACGDNTVRLFVVPHPNTFQTHKGTVYLRAQESRYTFSLPRISCTNIAWGGHSLLACGCTSGGIVIQDVKLALSTDAPIGPKDTIIHHILHHEDGVEAIAWHGSLETQYFVSTGRSGSFLVHNLEDIGIRTEAIRATGTRHAVTWTGNNVISIVNSENNVHGLSVRLGYDIQFKKNGKYIGHSGVVWTIGASEHHRYIVSGSSDGYLNVGRITKRLSDKSTGHPCLYHLVLDSKSDSLRFVDGEKSPGAKDPLRWVYVLNPIISVQKAVWNCNKRGSGWVASGGAAGLCRIEFVWCET